MYTNLQEPMLNAITQQNQSSTQTSTTQTSTQQQNTPQNQSSSSSSPTQTSSQQSSPNPFISLFSNPSQTQTSSTTSSSQTQSPNPNSSPLPNPWAPSSPTPNNTTSNNIPGLFDFNPLSMNDPASLTTLLQNPAIQTMMQQMFSNPELTQQVLNVFKRKII